MLTPRALRAAVVPLSALAALVGAGTAAAAYPSTTGPAPTTRPWVAAPTPWPEAFHDPRHTGASASVGPQSAAVRWRCQLRSGLTGGPVVEADGTILVATDDGILHALDPATGDALWTLPSGQAVTGHSDLSTSPAVLPDGTIAWPAPGGRLIAVDPEGHELGAVSWAGTVLSPVVASADSVDVVTTGGQVSQVTVGPTGPPSVAWTLALGGGPAGTWASPALASDGTLYTAVGSDLVAVSTQAASATVAWRFPTGGAIEVSPAVTPDGDVVVGSNDPFMYAVSPSGHLVWKARRLHSETYSSTSATADGLVYYGDNNGVVSVTQAATGAPVARYQGLHGIWSLPVVDAHHDAYFASQGGHVYGYTYSGRRLFDADVGSPVDSYPALTGDGTLLVGTEGGVLYAFG